MFLDMIDFACSLSSLYLLAVLDMLYICNLLMPFDESSFATVKTDL